MTYETQPLPADWALARAKEENGCTATVAVLKDFPRVYSGTVAFARYIEKHEQPPVDPWLGQARELAAGVAEELRKDVVASEYRAGRYDDDPEVRAIAAALKAAYEKGKAE